MNGRPMQALKIADNYKDFISNLVFKRKFKPDVPNKRTHFSEQSHNFGRDTPFVTSNG